FPHFRLYDLPGSPCDTLGINGPQPPEDTLPPPPVCAGSLGLWPNPVSSMAQLQVPACAGGSVRIFDVAGRWLQDLPVPEGGGTVPLDVSDYPSGVYFLHWRGAGGRGEVRRLAVLR
ncbi:MAG: T9SS type A sorting domain-containing protein, partial [Saprospiraceae bacterium]